MKRVVTGMGSFLLLPKYKQKLPFRHAFWLLRNIKKENFNHHNFSANKQYVKIKLMQHETNGWNIFFGKDEILVKL